MFKSITVTIDGKEYRLRGRDEDIVRSAAEEVNEQLDLIKIKSSDDWPATTLPVLAALNIAERELELKKKSNQEINFLIEELNKMADFLESSLN